MVPVLLAVDEDGNLTDGNILITDLHTWLYRIKVEDSKDDASVEVPKYISGHCTVTNINSFLSRLTLILTSVDKEGFNLGSIKGSIICFGEGESWEFYGRTDDMGYYDKDDNTTGDPCYSKIRGAEVCDLIEDGWDVNVYAIEEYEINPSDLNVGGLEQIG